MLNLKNNEKTKRLIKLFIRCVRETAKFAVRSSVAGTCHCMQHYYMYAMIRRQHATCCKCMCVVDGIFII